MHSVHTETAISSASGIVDFNLSGFKYIGNFAIFKAFSEHNYITTIYPEYAGGGSKLKFYNNDRKFIEISYNDQYNWEVSQNAKFLGSNALGQQVYALPGPGNYSLHIRGAQIHMVIDWITAIGIDIGVPLWLIASIVYRKSRK
jgi:hypothetical protein